MTAGAPAIVRYRKPPELAALGRRHAFVEASAGTGKTYVLEHLVVDLLLTHDAKLEEILVVTFTEKATAELVHRVRSKIQELRDLQPDHPQARAAQDVPDADCWTIDDRARRRLREALFAFDRASICTIHGFCQRIINENAFAQKRLFDEEIIDEKEAFHAAFTRALRQDIAPEPARRGYLAAWLGSGKDLARLERLLWECHHEMVCLHPARSPLRPEALDEVALRTAVSAWAPLPNLDAIRAALKSAKVHPNSAKAAVERLVHVAAAIDRCREGGSALGLLSELDQIDNKSKAVRLAEMQAHLGKAATHPAVASWYPALANVLAAAIPLSAAVAHSLLGPVRVRLEAHKRGGGLYDFSDMLSLVARSLDGEGAAAHFLLGTLRAQYRFALIDEFQDTDEVQWHIFRRLFLDSDGPGANRHVVTVIGDPKQAIYSFRGADVHTYLQACAQIAAAGSAPVYLTANHRSSAALIQAYNALLDQGEPAPFFRNPGRIHYHHPVSCGRPELAAVDGTGQAQPAVVVLDVQTKEATLLTWQVKRALLGHLVGEIGSLLSEGGRLFMRSRRDAPAVPVGARDIFVLTRTNCESREVGDALRAAGLPFAYFKQEYLFHTVEAREILDLLRAIAAPDDATARARAFITRFFGLSLPDLTACEDLPGGHPLLVLLHEWKALADAGDFDRLFARIIEGSGIVSREVFGSESERALTNYLHILEILQEEAGRSRGTIAEVAQMLGAYINGTRKPARENGDMQRLETDGDAVQIMTTHQAKGLEAAVVFLYGGFWPGPAGEVRPFHDDAARRVVRVGRMPAAETESWQNDRDDEERRVLYVALTRARGRMYLPRYPRAFGKLQGSYRFVNERLHAVLDGFTAEKVRGLFHCRPVSCPMSDGPAAPADVALPVAGWRPPAALLERAAASDDNAGEFAEIAASRAGFVTTSYSAIKRRHGGFVAAEGVDDDPTSSERAPEDTGGPPAVLAPRELPRGRLSGRFLHQILEEVSLEGLAGTPPLPLPLPIWRARPEVRALFERLRRRHDQDPAHLSHAEELVHTALTEPVRAGDALIPGLAAAAHIRREMEFLYPIPERSHPLLAAAGQGETGWAIERGCVKGFIDVLFEHQGRAYVCDWKGDWLPAWDAAVLVPHCQRNYEIQARLYTIAALRLLGVAGADDYQRRFGGVLYCFLRGMSTTDPSSGIHFARPTWDEVLAWQKTMLRGSFWGLA